MFQLPTLYTPRLYLRPFTVKDASRLHELLADGRIAATILRIPFPYPAGEGERWIYTHAAAVASGKEFVFAVTFAGTRTPDREHDPSDTGHLIGCVGLRAEDAAEQAHADLGYWTGLPYWRKGFATEAGHAALNFAFTRLHLHRVTAQHLTSNPASGRVMQKLGMLAEGTFRQPFHKNGQFHDVARYAILQEAWARQRQSRQPWRSRGILEPA